MVGVNVVTPSWFFMLTLWIGSRGPAVLDDFTSSYGYKFSDAAGYQWPTSITQNSQPNKL